MKIGQRRNTDPSMNIFLEYRINHIIYHIAAIVSLRGIAAIISLFDITAIISLYDIAAIISLCDKFSQSSICESISSPDGKIALSAVGDFRLSSSRSLLIIPRRQPSATTNTAEARTISKSMYTCSIGVCSVTL